MKKLIVFALVLSLVAVFAACSVEVLPEDSEDYSVSEETTVEESSVEDSVVEESSEDESTDTFDPSAKSEGSLTHAEFIAAEQGQVTIEAFVQAKQIYSEGYSNTCLLLADPDGAYFVYRWGCTQEEYDAISVGDKVKVTGLKSVWNDEVEITYSDEISLTVEKLDGTWTAESVDLTDSFAAEDLINYQNAAFNLNGLTVAASTDADGNEVAYLYKWNGAGEDGDDIYFNVTLGENTYTFVVESDLCVAGSDVYEAVKALNIGDQINVTGYLYWYNGAQPWITSVSEAE